jgi:hypothetical protein
MFDDTPTIPESHIAGGIYYHPIIFLDIAIWCGCKYYINAALIVLEYFKSNEHRENLLKRVMIRKMSYADAEDADDCFGFSENGIYQRKSMDKKYTYVMHGNLKVKMYRNDWYNTSKFCPTTDFNPDQAVGDFEKKHKSMVAYLGEDLFKIRDTNGCYYYHAVIFLMYTRWIDYKLFERIATIVLSQYKLYKPVEQSKKDKDEGRLKK